MSADFNLLKVFLAVAQAGNFSAAADQLGVTRSAVSQSMRRLEDDLGIALVQRSTRSVSLTEAGVRLRAQITEPFTAIASAVEEVVDDGPPRGLLRVAVTSIAERFLSGPLVATFAAAYPNITLDVTVTDEEFDIVGAGFDAGVRLGEVIEQDMVAVPLSGLQRQVVVASPRYLQRHGTPEAPFELLNHLCIGWRPAPSVAPYRWEFAEDGREFDVGVNSKITTNDMLLMIRTALAGGGITIGMEETFLPWIESGELVSLLQPYLPPFPGFYLYFPNRRNQPPKLRALIAHVRAYREAMEPS
ncbi:LysR family transcriptional regulator [Halomonas alkaliantarctica]|uniref:LysR family transcriptional regulator n=1 Tax=Halomonas alkaliantarctica TaxID=232346 RepID=A0ABY8LS99_9GAMM|nr:LysR family transcriptional regulator [Halomonas alkaliantarctica]WGI27298.1 LysR family transcriptional regulator [Halomonas alkaliantarctica]